MHIIAAKAVAFGEALQPEFKAYQQQVLNNAQALAQGLLDNGMELVSGGTDNHLMLIDLRNIGISGRELEVNLDSVRITANKNKIPNDPRSATETSGIRVGTPATTTRGFKEAEMKEVAQLIAMAAKDIEGNREEIIARVDALCKKFPLYA